MSKQYKDFQSIVKDVDEKGRVLVAANAIGNVDSDSDISMDGSFNKTLSENFNRVKWFLNHNTNILLGVPIEGKQEGSYLQMLGQLNMKKEIARDTYEDYKLYAEYGRTLEHSIGVTAIKWQNEGNVRKVAEWKLWEYSTLTSWGANENTPLLGIKSNKELEDGIAFLNIALKKGNYTDQKFQQIEKSINHLESLLKEPPGGTLIIEPDNDYEKLKEAIQLFIQKI